LCQCGGIDSLKEYVWLFLLCAAYVFAVNHKYEIEAKEELSEVNSDFENTFAQYFLFHEIILAIL
jgi:hypothetical protein